MADNVLDLCSSDEEDQRRVRRRQAPARAPQLVSLLDDDDVAADNDDTDLDRKPAARQTPRKRGHGATTSTCKRTPPDVVDLISEWPQLNRKIPPATAAKRPSQDISHFMEVLPPPPPKKPKTPLERVFEVFPDVELNHAEKVLRECSNNLETVLSILAERAYPKSKHNATTPSSAGIPVAGSVVVKRTKVQPKYDYMSASSFEPSNMYSEEAVARLLYDFPFLRSDAMKTLCRQGKNHYSIVRKGILDVLKGVSKKAAAAAASSTDEEELKQFQRFKPVWTTKRPTEAQRQAFGTNRCLKRSTRRAEPSISDQILKEEVHHAQWQLDEWMLAMEERIKRQEARKRSEKSGSGVECGCCFDRVPIEEMVSCRQEGHLFCGDCIQSYADTAVFSNGSLGVVKATGKPSCELLCCDSSGCQSAFPEEHLQRALPVKTLEKLNELTFRATIEAAGLQEEIW
jgi:hypothetical protein